MVVAEHGAGVRLVPGRVGGHDDKEAKQYLAKAERHAAECEMEAERQAEQQQATVLAAFQQAFPWMEAPVYVDLTMTKEDDADAT